MASQVETQALTFPVDSEKPTNEHIVARLVSRREGVKDIDFHAGDSYLLGRGKACNVLLMDDLRVSNTHCKIWHGVEDNEFRVYDASSNGTFVNSKKIGRNMTTTFYHGDIITLAHLNKGVSYKCCIFQPQVLEDEIISAQYDVKEMLGKGAFSIVKKAVHLATGKVCALKVVDKRSIHDPKVYQQMKREVDIMKSLEHPNIIRYLDSFDSPLHLYIVVEFAKGGELLNSVVDQGRFSEPETRQLFLQILRAVSYLHNNGIVHRDLKPENILFDSGQVKLVDFGLARMTHDMFSMKTLCGTPLYVAPEIILLSNTTAQLNSGGGYSKAVDMWSLGVILFIMLTGLYPFAQDPTEQKTLFAQILECNYTFDTPDIPFISDPAKDLVKNLLQREPSQRITAGKALNHHWITGHSLQEL